MAAFDAGSDLAGLTHHSDQRSNYMAVLYTDRIAELGAIPQPERSEIPLTTRWQRPLSRSTKPS